MPPTIVLVTFYSRCGATESLALSAAVGAVQARAGIRLRRLPDSGAPDALETAPECRDTLRRMHKEYVAPTEADVLGADALILGAPGGARPESAEWAEYMAMLARLQAHGKLAGKVAAVVDVGNDVTRSSFAATIRELGLVLVPAEPSSAAGPPDAIALGRRVAAAATAARQTAS